MLLINLIRNFFSENSEDSPQRMRTRNKTKEQTTNNRGGSGNRPKRGGTETPEPKPSKQPNTPSTPDKLNSTPGGVQTNNTGTTNINNNNTTPSKKNKASTNTKSSEVKADTPHKRKRPQDGKDSHFFTVPYF